MQITVIQTKSDSSCPRHSCQVIIQKNMYARHPQYSLGMCNFPFQVWSLWGCKIMFLVEETVPSNKLCSCPSRAQLYIYKEMVWLKGLLYIFKSWCNCQKRQLTQFSFWWVKPFLPTNGVPSKQMVFLPNKWQLFFFERRNGSTFKWFYFQTWRPAELL